MADKDDKSPKDNNTLGHGQKKTASLDPGTKKHNIKCKANEDIEVIEFKYFAIQDHPIVTGRILEKFVQKDPCIPPTMSQLMRSKKLWGKPALTLNKNHWAFIIKLANGKEIVYDKDGDFKEINEFKIFTCAEIKAMGKNTPTAKLVKYYKDKHKSKSTYPIRHGIYAPEFYSITKLNDSFKQDYLNELAKVLIKYKRADLEICSLQFGTSIKNLLPPIKVPKAIFTGAEIGTQEDISVKRTYNSISTYFFPIQIAANAEITLNNNEKIPIIITPGILESNFKGDKKKVLYYQAKELSTKNYTKAEKLEIEFAEVRFKASVKQISKEIKTRKSNFEKFIKFATYQPKFDDNRFDIAKEWINYLELYAHTDSGSRVVKCVIDHYEAIIKKKYIGDDGVTFLNDFQMDSGTGDVFRLFKIISPQSAAKKGGKQDAPGNKISILTGVGGARVIGPKILAVSKDKIKYSTSELSKRDDKFDNSSPLDGMQKLALGDMPVRVTFGGDIEIFHLAILHHEFSHTMFGLLNTDKEMEPVDEWENPVRLMFGHVPRTSYVKIDAPLNHPFRFTNSTLCGDKSKNIKIYEHRGCSKYLPKEFCKADINAKLPTVTKEQWKQLQEESQLLKDRIDIAIKSCIGKKSKSVCDISAVKWKKVYFKAYEDGKPHNKRMTDLESAINNQ